MLEPPTPKLHRQWSVANAGVKDHRGAVELEPLHGFRLDDSIFRTVKGRLARAVTRRRLGQKASWSASARQDIQAQFRRARDEGPRLQFAPQLLDFLERACDFSPEHADGSFWDHLYFGYEYALHHYPRCSATVMLLHSILGTGTNTFAMAASDIPELKNYLSDFEWRHIEAFPSLLRLIYHGPLLRELEKSEGRWDNIKGLRCHRVIDNRELELCTEDLVVQLNYQLLHFIDFLPLANWHTHRNDLFFILFRRLYAVLARDAKLQFDLIFDPQIPAQAPIGATRPWMMRWVDHLPEALVLRFASRGVEGMSQDIGHSLNFELLF